MDRRIKPTGTWVSVLAHVLVLGVLLVPGRRAWRVRPAGSGGSARHTTVYWQAGAAPQPIQAKRVVRASLEPTPVKAAIRPTAAQAREEASAAAGSDAPSTAGGVGEGAEEATPAFPVFSPSPRLADRSLLPPVNQNVVVDVKVSADGVVLDEKLVRGLGNGVDQIILDTVKGWKFHPATMDGSSVASVAELVFPVSQKWRG
jgi:outer membrane biosynthesis protein TonB